MCGIFCYIGKEKKSGKMMVDGLKTLEYRGYDSWGIAMMNENNDEIFVHKQVGKISDFSQFEKLPDVRIAIGHSRWATHGGVTDMNAHPQVSEDQNIAVVHNGIIENFQELRKELKKNGHTFTSDTDTEIIPHLIEEYLEEGFEKAVLKAVDRLQGRYAVVCIMKGENKIIAARRGSPLIIGVNGDSHYLASDIPAFLKMTRKVMYLDDNQAVILSDHDARFLDLDSGEEIKKRVIEINLDPESAEKGEYPHFMIKEIMEQKDTIHRTLHQNQDILKTAVQAIRDAKGTFIIGCGTAGRVALAASYIFSRVAKHHVNVVYGSEFPNYHHFLTDKTLLIAISQSGETADTLEAIEVAQEKGVKIMSIVNVESSTMARISDIVVPLKVGPEKAVASTKATTAQMAIMTQMAYLLADRGDEGNQLLINTASKINDMLNPRYEKYIHKLALYLKDYENIYVIGKGLNYPMALEAAIKLQEVSYIHAEGFAAGELKHGPIALITEGTPCIVLVSNDEMKQEVLSNAIEVKARGGYIIGVSPENNEIFNHWIKVPDTREASPITNIIPIQLLAYELAVIRKNDPDQPRNLAKSVTVK